MFFIKFFLINYCGNMLVVICICIFVVDFCFFFCCFVKVEIWGIFFMDMGVGLFVYFVGIVVFWFLLKE